MQKLYVLLIAVVGHILSAAQLPSGLVASEVSEIIEQIGEGGTTKALGQFNGNEKWWPGFRVGVEFNFFQGSQLNTLGNGNAATPTSFPSLRLLLHKKWPKNIETVFQMVPRDTLSSVGTIGGMIKFPVYEDHGSRFVFFPFGAFTKISAFDGQLEETTFEAGLILNKDFPKWRPYLGLGCLFLNGEIDPTLTKAGNASSASYSTLHLFAGLDWNMLTNFSITAQLDFMNLSPRGSASAMFKF